MPILRKLDTRNPRLYLVQIFDRDGELLTCYEFADEAMAIAVAKELNDDESSAVHAPGDDDIPILQWPPCPGV